ncbi:MAG: hypothetical protein ACR2OM_00775 [Aestuariivirgaceae bacterium]
MNSVETNAQTGIVELADHVAAYFRAIDGAFAGLDAGVRSQSEQVKRNNLIYQALSDHLARLRHSFTCWQHKCLYTGRFKIDRAESGFPVFQHVLDLAADRARRQERLLDMPTGERIREEMLELLLKYKQFPRIQQRTMAERVLLDALNENEIFEHFTAPQTLRHSMNPRSGRPYYVIHWAAYDGIAHLPMVYTAVIEDSSENAPKPPKAGKHSKRRGPWGTIDADDFPNLEISDKLRRFLANQSAYSLTLTTIASKLDEDFPNLHPKQLRRFVLGPFYAGGITSHNETVQSVLDSVGDSDENWLLTWTMQELHSKEEVAAKHGIWGGSPARELYYINTDDVDCVAQGVSAFERHALIPHSAYQAVYAQGRADEIFKDYQCYIASGEHILTHV